MINNTRQIAIQYLLLNNIVVTEENIEEYLNTNPSIVMNDGFDDNFMNSLTTNVLMPAAAATQSIDECDRQISHMRDSILGKIDELSRRIYTQTIPSIKMASVIHKDMGGYVKTVVIDPNLDIDAKSSNISISDGIITTEEADDVVTVVGSSDISVSMLGTDNNDSCSIEKIDGKYLICGQSRMLQTKRIDIVIDKKNTNEFNRIFLSFDKIELVLISTSNDNVSYTSTHLLPDYVLKKVLHIGQTTNRYIKISIFKHQPSEYANGIYKHKAILNDFKIGRSIAANSAEFETKEISVDAFGSSISVSDCCGSRDNIDITYSLSINGGDYNPIKASNDMSDALIPKILNINDYYDNKIIYIDNTNIETGIPEELLVSNSIRVFDASGWYKINGGMQSNFIIKRQSRIDIGRNTIGINGKLMTGEIDIAPGLYKVTVFDGEYQELFNNYNILTDNGYSGNSRVFIDKNNTSRSIYDRMYPYNTMYVIQDVMDINLGKELIEKMDYSLYNNDGKYTIASADGISKVYIAYKAIAGQIDTIKLKASIKAKNSKVAPSISKIFINIA